MALFLTYLNIALLEAPSLPRNAYVCKTLEGIDSPNISQILLLVSSESVSVSAPSISSCPLATRFASTKGCEAKGCNEAQSGEEHTERGDSGSETKKVIALVKLENILVLIIIIRQYKQINQQKRLITRR